MTSLRRRILFLPAFALAVPVLLVLTVTLSEPPLERRPSEPGPGEVVGVLHVHTVASDGAGTVDQVLAAAAAAGLDFVLLTDHNRWGAPAWTYRDSVLLIVGEEVNTPWGHLVVAGGSPVGDRREVKTVPAVGPGEGLRIAAHPTGKTRWTGWDGQEFDGIEIWNADTERRNDGKGEWVRALALLPLRPLAALYQLLDRPTEELRLWDRLMVQRPVFGVCGVDAHNTLPLNRSRTLDLHFPAYRHSFALARQHVILSSGLSADAVEDGHRILEAIARGRSYCAFDGLADARGARFRVVSGGVTATLGDTVAWQPGARLEVVLPTSAARKATVKVVRLSGKPDHAPVADGRSEVREMDPSRGLPIPGPGIYRFEVTLERRHPVPWILTNPIRVVASSGGEPAGGDEVR